MRGTAETETQASWSLCCAQGTRSAPRAGVHRTPLLPSRHTVRRVCPRVHPCCHHGLAASRSRLMFQHPPFLVSQHSTHNSVMRGILSKPKSDPAPPSAQNSTAPTSPAKAKVLTRKGPLGSVATLWSPLTPQPPTPLLHLRRPPQAHLRAFALALPSAWDALPPGTTVAPSLIFCKSHKHHVPDFPGPPHLK